jgi:hypothetical protein
VLVVVEHGNLHAFAAFALDDEAVRRLDVFEVDAAEGRLERGDHLDQLVRIGLVQLDIEHIDAGKLLEQHRLAFHDRFGRERADIAETQHRGTVSHNPDQVAARGEARGIQRVLDDLFARERDTGGIRQREVALVDHLLGRRDRDLPGSREFVIIEGGFAEFGVDGIRHKAGWSAD